MYENIVYKYTFPNGKVYIGITNNEKERKYRHKIIHNKEGHSKYNLLINKAFRKYGYDNVEYEVICRCRNYKTAKIMEMNYIKQYRSYANYPNSNGYNLTLGGEGTLGFVYSEESRRKMSESQKGRVSPHKGKQIWRDKIHPRLGTKHSDESKKKISESKKGTPSWNKGMKFDDPTKHNRYGTKHSEEAIRKMSDVKKGKKMGSENPFAKPKEHYETKLISRTEFKRRCKVQGWIFEDFSEIIGGFKDYRKDGKIYKKKLYNYFYKNKE
ncbi:MAG: NUMOD3 domain-containing DNA-binding protein [Paraclostridium sp.]